MSDQNNTHDSIQIVKALTEVSTSVATTSIGVAELRSDVKDLDRDVRARMENLDRSHQELRLGIEKDAESRDLLINLLQEERDDRRKATAQDRETSIEVRKEAREDVKEWRGMFTGAFSAVWDKGGQWLILGVVLIFLALLNQQLDLGLPFFDLITGGDTGGDVSTTPILPTPPVP